MAELARAGVEAFTLGDHLKDMSVDDLVDVPTVRPANLRGAYPGDGHRIVESKNGKRLLLFSLLGNAFLKLPINNYFKAADTILAQYARESLDGIFLDFHAEATSEANALGHYLDGLVSAVIGTHTHVPTADTRLLPKGTAYQSDAGMCGGYDSAIGFDIDNATRWLHRELGDPLPPEDPVPASGKPFICDAVLIETASRQKARSITRLTTRPAQA
jgi:metallophosphoesterase (TIGR00282 family)